MKQVIAAIHEFAKLIKSIGTILGFLTALYLVAVNFAAETGVGRWLANFGDQFIAKERFFEGYLYYEVGEDGGLTPYGQLVVLPGKEIPLFKALEHGDILEAQSEVYLRPQPTTKERFLRVHGNGQCFEVVEKVKEITGSALGKARSGGWVSVVETECPK